MTAIEIADSKEWHNLWIETDSSHVVMAYKSPILVPWNLRNRWYNCMTNLTHMNIIVSHIFREGNHCADGLANLGLSLGRLTLWFELPHQIKENFDCNRLGKPFFRVVHS
jgi:hypothetical protein